MATHKDLIRLSIPTEGPLVSLYLPTSPRGAETEDAALHLKVLRSEAEELLVGSGLSPSAAKHHVAAMVAMESDREFWQHQQHGLAVFCASDGVETISLADHVEPSVSVSDHYDLLPLLPHLQPEGTFMLLELSQNSVTLFSGNHDGLEVVEVSGMPDGIDGVLTEDDYQNPAYASPPARPNVGHLSMSHAQVYGQAPPEWKKALRERYVEHISRALEGRLANTAEPTVLVADEELAGLMAARVDFTHTNTTHPTSMSKDELHALAWAAVSEKLDSQRMADIENFRRALGQGGLATTDVASTLLAATEGRVAVLLVTGISGGPEVSTILHRTLTLGGRVVFAPELNSSVSEGLGAILRYS